MLDDVESGMTYNLYFGELDLPDPLWELNVRGTSLTSETTCMQGIPFEVSSYSRTYFRCDGPCEQDEDCDDSKICTSEQCDLSTGQCTYSFVDPCCEADGLCDDSDPCTHDWGCTEDEHCLFTPRPEGAGCHDDDPCTINEECRDGVCEGVARPFDWNCDVSIDWEDLAKLADCMNGPWTPVAPGCTVFTGNNYWIDLRDVALFQRSFTGN